MENRFKGSEAVRFETTCAGVTTTPRVTVVKTVLTARGVRVAVKDKNGDVYRPHLSMVKLTA